MDITVSNSMSSLLQALGLSDSNPAPPTYQFKAKNPMGTLVPSSTNEEEEETSPSAGTGEAWLAISAKCSELVEQVIKLVKLDECVSGSERLLVASVTQTSRRIILKLLSFLSIATDDSIMEDIELDNVQHLIRLLRLVQANRVGMATEGGEELKEVIGSAITGIVSKSKVGGAGTQLLQVIIIIPKVLYST